MAPLLEAKIRVSSATAVYEPVVEFWMTVVLSLATVVVLLFSLFMCACCGEKPKEGEMGKAEDGKGKEGVNPQYVELDKPAEEKKREPPPTKGIDPANPAYQTLVHESKFEATKGLTPPPVSPSSASAPGTASKVSGANPAYQTLVHDSKFEASTKGKSTKASVKAKSTKG